MKIRTLALASGALAAALALTGCTQPGPVTGGTDGSGDGPATSGAAVDHNAADATFVMAMIPHHEQAIEMADLILDKVGIDDRVVALAERIQAAQGPEIDTMSAWLEDWGVEPVDSGMAGMDHGDGMMSDDDLTELDTAEGADASRLFLEQMIEHHQGALDMASQELGVGLNPEALALARGIVEDQTAEIAEMQELLGQL